MLRTRQKIINCCALVNASHLNFRNWKFLNRNYHWVYNDGEDGYDEKKIEDKFTSLSQGGEINFQTENDIALVVINNEPKRNAMSGTMLVRLRDVTKKLWNWKEGKAVVICGANSNFCSGLDLSLAKKLSGSKDGKDMCMYMQNTLTLFQLLPMITVAAIKGNALGGGAEITTAADFRLMFPDARIQFLHKRMGIIPGWGGATRLREIVGSRKTLHLLASSEALDCKSALMIGLVDALASENSELSISEVTTEWLEKTFKLSKTDHSVFRAMKEAASDFVWTTEENRRQILDHRLRHEKNLLLSVWGKPSNLKALKRAIHS